LADDAAAHCRALQLVLPVTGGFTHLTAARLHGWWLPPLPDDLPCWVAVPESEPRPRRRELRTKRLRVMPAPVIRERVRMLPAAEVLLACARDLGTLDMVVLADAALRAGDVALESLGGVLAGSRPGSARLRRVIALADARSESAWESVLRLLRVALDVPVEPQHTVHDGGGFVARGDLWLVATSVLHEYDGGEHLLRERQRSDLRRARRIGNSAWLRGGYTSDDVLHRAVTILRDADLSLGRPHAPERVRAWHALLSESLFTPSGTARLRRRWGLPPEAPTGRRGTRTG
jgi:hypothetical protein